MPAALSEEDGFSQQVTINGLQITPDQFVVDNYLNLGALDINDEGTVIGTAPVSSFWASATTASFRSYSIVKTAPTWPCRKTISILISSPKADASRLPARRYESAHEISG